MTHHASRILTELRQDHRNMSKLLAVIEYEAERLYDVNTANFELVHAIMLYMTSYPDAVHHPKEDRLYAEMKAARPDLSRGMSKITAEHRNIALHGLKLRDSLQSVIAGRSVRQNMLVADALRYANALHSHMQWEEEDLFRRADRMIRDGHDVIDKAIFVQYGDPLFGSKVEKRFALLFDILTQTDGP